ncbi:MAG: hypothetical protein COV66_01975 [Nitrospinae bacterium CG11_big_fil_rev_8_21_14_0_20_45_15]|nr:MAG: hypothetical protein COV66_01975 [Nitrospinae bacterium CG11_big_fil_rev_8_21_14_0_20_45_15]
MKHRRLFKHIHLLISVLFFCLSVSFVFAAPYAPPKQPGIKKLTDIELLPKNSGTIHIDIIDGHTSDKPTAQDNKPKTEVTTPYLSEKAIALAGFILTKEVAVGSIVKILDDTITVSDNGVVYIDIGVEKGAKKGDRLTVFSNQRIVYDPVQTVEGNARQSFQYSGNFDYWGNKRNNESRELGESRHLLNEPAKKGLGVLIQILGTVEILEPLNGYSRARVIRAHNDIQTGDLLMPYEAPATTRIVPVKADKKIEGRLIAFKEERITGIMGDIVYLDRGTRDNVQTGDFFEAYNIPTMKVSNAYDDAEEVRSFPPQVIGKLQVISTRKSNSTAVILNSQKDFTIGQRVRYKTID